MQKEKFKTLLYEEKVKVIEAVNTDDKKRSDVAKLFSIPVTL